MADITPDLDLLAASQSNKELRINELFDAASPGTIYGRRASTTTALTWGYYGGRMGGTAIANGTVTLIDTGSPTGSPSEVTNYIVANRATFVVSCDDDPTNWNNTAAYARLYLVTVDEGLVVGYEDHRAGPGGVFGAGGAGTFSVPIMASGMAPSATGGCASLAIVASASDKPDYHSLDFDASSQEYAQFMIPMPKRWNEGTVLARFLWSQASAGSGSVIWGIQGVALSDGDGFASTAYGTAQEVTDAGGSTGTLYRSALTPAMTIAGSPAAEDLCCFRVYRKAADGGDTLAGDARLHAVVLYIVTDTGTDE